MATNAQKARAGGHLVVAQLLRRGVGSVTFADNQRSIEITASSVDRSRTVAVRVKTKTTGDWQTTIELGEPRPPDDAEKRFWVLVDIGTEPRLPVSYFVVPQWWIHNYIHEQLQETLKRHGGRRARSPGSTHCAIRPADVESWRDCWDALGVCDPAS
jgi:hypothetical protein